MEDNNFETICRKYSQQISLKILREQEKVSFNNLKFARRSLGLSRSELADILGLKEKTIFDWETGRKSFGRIIQFALSELLENALKHDCKIDLSFRQKKEILKQYLNGEISIDKLAKELGLDKIVVLGYINFLNIPVSVKQLNSSERNVLLNKIKDNSENCNKDFSYDYVQRDALANYFLWIASELE